MKTSAADIPAFLAKLGRISDSDRDFCITVAEATKVLRIPQALLDDVVGQGMPHKDEGSGTLFDRNDLKSVMLHLGCGSMGIAMRRFWPATLNYKYKAASAVYEIRFESECVGPDEAERCEVRFFTPSGYMRAEGRTAAGAARLILRAEIFSDWPSLSKAHRDLIDTVASLEFMWLPEALCGDEEFMRRTGLGDCSGVSEMLNKAAAQHGVTARGAYGLIIAPPFCAPHYWTEFLVGERWVPVDPLLIGAMIAWGALRDPEWHIYRSPGVGLYRLGPSWVPLTEHTCGAARLSFPVRRITG